ncbi:MAG: hypothetical protein Q8O75_00260 [bacterium]|nr:hypothetical protein [bacterium]
MKNTNLSPIKIYIVPVLVLVTTVLLVPLVFMPQLARIKDKNLTVKRGNDRLTALNNKIRALGAIDENEESLKLIEMENVVPSEKNLDQLIVGVRNLAAQSDLKVIEFKLKPGKVATSSATGAATKKSKTTTPTAKKQEEKDKTTFTLSLNGELANINKFLDQIEKVKRLLGINVITTKRETSGTYLFDFEVFTPFKGVKSQGDVVAASLPSLTTEHLGIYNFVVKLENYTNVSIPLVPKGVTDPFK